MLEILPDELTPGLTVAGRYRLDRVVGEGGMGVVWAATHVLTEKKCALKFLKESRASDPRNHQRLLQEARSACAVRHPNVAQVHDILELASGVPFIVMDLLEGESLAALLARVGKLDSAQTIRILQPVVDAVVAAHKLGIVHRDLKPDNVFIEKSPDGRDVVKVLDFGIAKRLGGTVESSRAVLQRWRERSRLTTTFSVVGTPLYMAPEQVNGPGEFAEQVDVWSLGVIAYECVTGQCPEGLEDLEKVDTASLQRCIDKLAREVPIQFARLIGRMLEVNPAKRVTLAEVRETLVLQSPDLNTTVSMDAVTTEIANQAQRGRKWQRSLPWLSAAAVVAGFFAFLRGDEMSQAHVADEKQSRDVATHTSIAPLLENAATANVVKPVVTEPAPIPSALPTPTVSANSANVAKRSANRRGRSETLAGASAAQMKLPSRVAEEPEPKTVNSSNGIPTYDRK